MNLYRIVAVICIVLSVFACRKEDKLNTSSTALLSTSVDTVKFDTVFVNSGSVTKLFKVFNNNNQRLNLSSVKLMGGNTSAYKINVDGLPGIQFNNIEIAANDSMYVYVTVNINPATGAMPFVVKDSVQIQYNGNTRYVQLQSFGQNAIFLNNTTITTNTTFTKTLPYVILGQLTVAKDITLTINRGTKIYSHANAPIIIRGTLLVNGEAADTSKVIFAGDRLDAPYNEYAGAWPGILFTSTSKNNVLNYAIVKNAYQAIIADSAATNANPKIVLNQTIVDNAYDAGIISIGSAINATNCLISNCGKNVAIAYGGTYNFTHCTIASYSNGSITHTNPVLIATNYIRQSPTTVITNNMQAQFINCIFWGDFGTVEDEVVVDKQGTNPFSIQFNNCIYKVKTALNPIINNTAGIINAVPKFDSINTSRSFYDFRLQTDSPAKNAGAVTSTPLDLDGKPRPVGIPDIGAYEKQ